MNITPLLCAVFLALPLAAQRPENQRPRRTQGMEVLQALLQKYDANKDGRIERAEYPRTDAAFANLDRDKNGVVDARDLSVRPQRPAARGEQGARPEQPKLPKVGQPAPDFELPMLGMKGKKVKLGSFAGDRPVALIFGSYT